MKPILKRLNRIEQKCTPKEVIDTSFIKDLEELGYPVTERITDNITLDYTSQDKFERSVLELLTVRELKELAEIPVDEKVADAKEGMGERLNC